MQIIKTKSPYETQIAGKRYSEAKIEINDIIGLFGPLGSGKTIFTKGIASYFKVNDTVNSPTFLIVNEYKGINPKNDETIRIFHFDFYRVNNVDELYSIGLNEYLNRENSIFVIEWPELIENYLDRRIKKVEFSYGKLKNQRIIKY